MEDVGVALCVGADVCIDRDPGIAQCYIALWYLLGESHCTSTVEGFVIMPAGFETSASAEDNADDLRSKFHRRPRKTCYISRWKCLKQNKIKSRCRSGERDVQRRSVGDTAC